MRTLTGWWKSSPRAEPRLPPGCHPTSRAHPPVRGRIAGMDDPVSAWDRLSSWYQANAYLPTDVVHYGTDVPDEHELRLCGNVAGKRVLELGCGAAQNCIAFAKQGAKAIGIDLSPAQLAYGRRLAEAEEVKVELHEGDLADLGFATSGSIDLVFSANALNYVD